MKDSIKNFKIQCLCTRVAFWQKVCFFELVSRVGTYDFTVVATFDLATIFHKRVLEFAK